MFERIKDWTDLSPTRCQLYSHHL